jgi:hypothetical protein
MGMNQDLARAYQTPGHTTEDQEKIAQAELFAKLAAEQGINISRLSDAQVNELWDLTFNEKTAEESPFPPKDEKSDEDKKKEEEAKKEEEKKEAAAREHQQKLAFANEEARADYLGRKMAHAYVAELREIAINQEKQAAAQQPAAPAETKTASPLERAIASVKGETKVASAPAPAVPAAPQGFRVAPVEQYKQASALDQLAMEAAVKLASDAGFDPELAASRIVGLQALGGVASVKIAQKTEDQIQVRALEYLEAAGYPVNWQ